MVLSDFLPDEQPRLADLKSCEDWLARAALAGMPHACSALLTLLEEIEADPPRHSDYLQILERLRYPVIHAAEEQAKGFAGKPLPLNHSDAAVFVEANGLWAAMLRAYGRLLSAALKGKHPELEPSLARLFQRVLACAGEAIGTCLLARREFGAHYWKLLHQAYTAAEARGIGSDCTRLAAQDLLKTLQRAWLESAPERDFPRRASPSPMELVSGFAAIHHAIEGNPVAKSTSPSSYSYGEAERFHTFQPSAERDAREQGLETWETLGESDDGFRLRRGTQGMRLAHRQLVALRPGGARQFILCHVDWLIEGPDQTLTIGARVLKGEAKACAVRSSDRSAPQRSDALMLPVAPGLSPALVLPTGWYRRAGELELELGNAIRRITLSGLLERGFDYERVRVSTS